MTLMVAYALDLTEQELEVARLLAVGQNRKEVGELLSLSKSRVDQLCSALIRKTEAEGMVHAIAILFRRGVLS